jgi:hypothetical protein
VPDRIVVEVERVRLIEVGKQGPAGPPGQARVRRSAFHHPLSYLGVAVNGSTEGDAVWTITRITVASNGSVTETETATNVTWTGYQAHTYA